MAMERCEVHYLQVPVKGFWQHLGLLLQRLGERVTRWGQLAEQRRQLREMEDHMLKDIGLSRADVDRIAGHRWFWDDPRRSGELLDQRYRSPGR
jgi:uncharacterized protein YjiS (DUF1127 family)